MSEFKDTAKIHFGKMHVTDAYDYYNRGKNINYVVEYKKAYKIAEKAEKQERELQEAKEELLRSHDLSTKLIIENHVLKEKLNQIESEASE